MTYICTGLATFLCFLVCMGTSPAQRDSGIGKTYVFNGEWVTYNRSLDGSMTAHVTPLEKLENNSFKYSGRFFGVWQGVAFDYSITFTGKPNKLAGTALIDGASYEWEGSINFKEFKGEFSGNRYYGKFNLRK